MPANLPFRTALLALLSSLVLVACGGGGGSGSGPAKSYTVGGAVSGLHGTGLILKDNGGDALPVSADGSFTFATAVTSGDAYAVTVSTQPSSPAQTCTVADGSGAIAAADITNVTISCVTNTYTVSGSIGGLLGSGLVLEDNAGNDLSVTGNGSFSFSAPVTSGADYSVTVLTQPSAPAQTCVVADGTGTIAGANVTNVAVTCTTNTYSVGGTLSGLPGTAIVLQDNAGNNLPLSSNGNFVFATPVASGAPYAVTVLVQPTAEICTVVNGSGMVVAANITSVAITCVPSTYTVGGSITGLSGSGLVLQNNAGSNLAVSGSSFTFPTQFASGASYAITVLTQPTSPGQVCTVSNGSGAFAAANVTNVAINCVTSSFTVGGSVTGLSGTGLIIQDNGGNNLPVSGSSFTFGTPVASGANYAVTVLTPPSTPTQTCTVTNGSGTVVAANITNVIIACTTNSYTIGGSVTGLSGSGLVLKDNGGNNLSVTGSSFTFSTPIASNATYAVTVFTQPSTPTQTCLVSNGSGTVGGANVINVVVTCTTNKYNVGGNVSGLTGTGLVLQDNAGNNKSIAANGSFVFSTQVASGAAYAVTVLTQPTLPAQTCTVTNASGTVVSANITNVTVTCVASVGQFAYVATDDAPNGAIVGFTINPGTGALNPMVTTPTSPFAADLTLFSVAVDPTAQFVYAINQGSTDISLFSSDANTGALTLINSSAPTDALPSSIAIDSTGQFLFVANADGNSVSAFTITASSGALAQAVGSPYPAGGGPNWVTVDPSGLYVYVANRGDGTISVYSITPTTGVLAEVTGSPFNSGGSGSGSMAIDPSRSLLYVTNFGEGSISTFSIDESSGFLTLQGAPPVAAGSPGPYTVTIDPSNSFLYVTDFTDSVVYGYTITGSGGTLTQIGTAVPVGMGPFAASVDPSGQYLYVSNSSDGTVSEFSITAVTGVLAPLTGSPVFVGSAPGHSAIR
jgi:6-phosphogluconolactonase (cycloisomerase 2 family)/ribosomal protein S11